MPVVGRSATLIGEGRAVTPSSTEEPSEQPTPSGKRRVASGRARLLHTTNGAARGFAWLVVKLRFGVVALWVGVAVLAILHLPTFGSSSGPVVQLIPKNAPALQALASSIRLFRVPAQTEFSVVTRDPHGLSAAAQAKIVGQAAQTDSGSHRGGVAFALPVLNTARLFPASRESGTTAVTFLYFDQSIPVTQQQTEAATYAQQQQTQTGLSAGLTGAIPGQLRQGTLIDRNLTRIEIATLVLILLIIAGSYRSLGAPLIAAANIAVGFPIVVWALAQLDTQAGVFVPQELDPVVIALLLGIMTDYTIFFLSGVRTRLRSGDDRLIATRVTAAEFTPIILTSALILSLSLLGLLASTLGFFQNLGPALALTVAIGLVVSVTLIPALIATFGMLVYWPSRPTTAPTDPDSEARSHQQPTRIGRVLQRRRSAIPIVLLCTAGLGIAAWPLHTLRLGFGQISDLPANDPVKRAANEASQGFAPGILSPTTILIQQPHITQTHRPQLATLERLISKQPGVAATLGPQEQPTSTRYGVFLAPNTNAARVVVIFNHDPLGAAGIHDLQHLQQTLPSLATTAALTNAHISYAGDTALADDTVTTIHTDILRVAAVVLAINLLLLMVFLRGIIAPIFLLASSVLTVAAALGLTTWVFQTLLGYHQITYYVPFAVAVLLLALGSDYNIFVVGRIWQEAQVRPLPTAVALAAPQASRAIRAAGITLAASFAIIAIIPIHSFQETAFAMTTGILLETFIIRSLLAPALIITFGPLSAWPSHHLTPQHQPPQPPATTNPQPVNTT